MPQWTGAEGLLGLRVLQLAQSAEMTIRRIKIGILAASVGIGTWVIYEVIVIGASGLAPKNWRVDNL